MDHSIEFVTSSSIYQLINKSRLVELLKLLLSIDIENKNPEPILLFLQSELF